MCFQLVQKERKIEKQFIKIIGLNHHLSARCLQFYLQLDECPVRLTESTGQNRGLWASESETLLNEPKGPSKLSSRKCSSKRLQKQNCGIVTVPMASVSVFERPHSGSFGSVFVTREFYMWTSLANTPPSILRGFQFAPPALSIYTVPNVLVERRLNAHRISLWKKCLVNGLNWKYLSNTFHIDWKAAVSEFLGTVPKWMAIRLLDTNNGIKTEAKELLIPFLFISESKASILLMQMRCSPWGPFRPQTLGPKTLGHPI